MEELKDLDDVDFHELIEGLSMVEPAERTLIKQAYDNAVSDRNDALALFRSLSDHVTSCDENTAHAIHGGTLARYLERMHKSNETLLRIVDIITEARKRDAELDEDDLFDKISSSLPAKRSMAG